MAWHIPKIFLGLFIVIGQIGVLMEDVPGNTAFRVGRLIGSAVVIALGVWFIYRGFKPRVRTLANAQTTVKPIGSKNP